MPDHTQRLPGNLGAAHGEAGAIRHQGGVVHGRRSLLASAVAGFGAALLGSKRHACAALASDDEFLAVSKLLTGRADLNAETSRRLNAALSAADKEFPTRLSACAAFARTHGFNAAEPFAAALDAQDPQLAAVLHTVTCVWYTGVAGGGPQATVIAYRDALMFDVVGDVLTVPSYCRAAPNYWTAKPSTT